MELIMFNRLKFQNKTMSTLITEYRYPEVIIRLNRPKANAINMQMVLDLNDEISKIKTNRDAKGLILTGQNSFFSAGLDVFELYQYNEKEIMEFWRAFDKLVRNLVAFPKQFIVAINGHSPAGGCVLALCADYRVMANGAYRIGLNEVPVGIVVPETIFSIYSFWLGRAKAYRNLMEGKLFTADEALEIGLVDESVEQALVEERALEKLNQYFSFNRSVWKQSKLNLRKALLNKISGDFMSNYEHTIKEWWAPETREQIGKMLEGLKKK